VLGFRQRRRFCNVVDNKRRLRITVVHRGERSESLLAGGIPDLELDRARRKGAFLRQKRGWNDDVSWSF
jgi:hypothetical protein